MHADRSAVSFVFLCCVAFSLLFRKYLRFSCLKSPGNRSTATWRRSNNAANIQKASMVAQNTRNSDLRRKSQTATNRRWSNASSAITCSRTRSWKSAHGNLSVRIFDINAVRFLFVTSEIRYLFTTGAGCLNILSTCPINVYIRPFISGSVHFVPGCIYEGVAPAIFDNQLRHMTCTRRLFSSFQPHALLRIHFARCSNEIKGESAYSK